MSIRVAVWTIVALFAFAGNSIIARLALRENAIDAAGFSAVRLISGAAILAPFIWFRRGRSPAKPMRWKSGLALLVYAVGFSFAYVSLNAATGALILFASVQITMLGVAWFEGDRLRGLQTVGLVMALTGLAYLLLPGLEAPPVLAAGLMMAAGAAWGCYSLLGRGTPDPTLSTAYNFLAAGVLAVISLPAVTLVGPGLEFTSRGVQLAVLSGAVTSGLGYVIWYEALRGLTASSAATVQLAVPVIAAWGGVLLLGEAPTQRLLIAAVMILGGVGLTLRRAARV